MLPGELSVSIVDMKDKPKDFEDERDYDPKELSFYNGLHTVEDIETKEQHSFFDYLWNRLIKIKDA